MTHSQGRFTRSGWACARRVSAYALATATTASMLSLPAMAQTVDLSKWSPEYVKSIAGTHTFDTNGDCAAVVPADYKGKVSYWYTGPFEADPEIAHKVDKDFWEAFKAAYPNIETDVQSITYNELLDKFRTSLLGNAAPMVVRLQILGGVEFSAKGYLNPLKPEDVGYSSSDFWPGAMKSVTYDGVPYGIPTNNETMALIWNAKIFKDAGLDPENPPATWDDLVTYSKTIKDKLGISGYGLVAKQNAGNTPFRFMPQLWAYGGGALDEAADSPSYTDVWVNNDGSKAALQAAVQMYVTDKSAPTSALTNTQAENQAPFIAGQLAMMIAHPSEYARMVDLSSKATGADKAVADEVIENMRYGLIPEGPARRAVVFGGSNIHVVKPEYVNGGAYDEQAVKALVCMWTSPEWSTKLAWTGSNPGHLGGFTTEWMKERLDTIKFLDVTTSMLPNGIPFPVLPESPEIMNIVIPDMMQNALTGAMTVDEAVNDAAAKIEEIIGGF
ncbi:extracellular solute-binding protein [Devosia sp. MC521]|uniref:extracellular solute-binding protein n=1 Tax=Devosia sp. MC521 TaxID=2759954 RepID=UPI0015FB1C12|nr:extracellular solute-binding protein [Devosia sp. MC521]MBJ6985857.1 extracellular solute-binding protein [Devosia sp. MC521]QMW61234.1 extracellular solute-binding protein [Devosia sp. MC521]